MECQIDMQIETVSSVLRTLDQSLVVNRGLSQNAKLSVQCSIHIPTLTCGLELVAVTKRTRRQKPAVEIHFLHRVC